jgi:hypothetical protein
LSQPLQDPGAPAVLRDYALLADGERGALVGPQGAISWLCFPRWDSPAVFCSLLGGHGQYSVCPDGRWVWGGYYEDGLIWRNRWTTEQGRVECRDALALPGRPDKACILRTISAHGAPARVRIRLSLRAEFGRYGARDLHRDDGGAWRGRLGAGRSAGPGRRSPPWSEAGCTTTSRPRSPSPMEGRTTSFSRCARHLQARLLRPTHRKPGPRPSTVGTNGWDPAPRGVSRLGTSGIPERCCTG